MSSAIRPWLIWLLLLALPMQGLAAATMLWCDTLGASRLAASTAMAPQQADNPHVCIHGHAAPAEAVADSDAVVTDAGHHGGSGACSACASCCAAFAVPASLAMLSSIGPGSDPLRGPAAGAARYTTDGPERPPRPLPA
jgi:hypothetical protein